MHINRRIHIYRQWRCIKIRDAINLMRSPQIRRSRLAIWYDYILDNLTLTYLILLENLQVILPRNFTLQKFPHKSIKLYSHQCGTEGQVRYLNTRQHDHWSRRCYIGRAISTTATEPNGNFFRRTIERVRPPNHRIEGELQRVERLYGQAVVAGSRRDPIFVRLWSGDRKTSITRARAR